MCSLRTCKKLSISILLMVFCFLNLESKAQSGVVESEDKIEILFNVSSSVIDEDFANNKENLWQLSAILDRLNQNPYVTITKINVSSYASPDGGTSLNSRLSQQRKESIYNYLIVNEGIISTLIDTTNTSDIWDELRSRVVNSATPYKREVIAIIDNIPVKSVDENNNVIDSRLKHLKELHNGEPYEYMKENIFAELRSGSVLIIHYENILVPVETSQNEPEAETQQIVEQQEEKVEEPQEIVPITAVVNDERDFHFALKTNLALYAGGILNVAGEVQINDMFSVDVPIAYSPYTVNQNWKFRVLTVQPEFRYWFNETFKGHFVGAHAHVGYFNIAYNDQDRFQNSADTPLWGFGLSYGYLLNICGNWGLEFTLGAGYANLEYDTYYNIDNGALFDHTKKDYWGITRLGISLTYTF